MEGGRGEEGESKSVPPRHRFTRGAGTLLPHTRRRPAAATFN